MSVRIGAYTCGITAKELLKLEIHADLASHRTVASCFDLSTKLGILRMQYFPRIGRKYQPYF